MRHSDWRWNRDERAEAAARLIDCRPWDRRCRIGGDSRCCGFGLRNDHRRRSKRQQARTGEPARGHRTSINTTRVPDLGSAIRAVVPRGVNFLVDAAGVDTLIGMALTGLARRGTLGLVAVPPSAEKKLDVPWASVLLQGQTVRGFMEGNSVPDIFIPRMIELYAQGRLSLRQVRRASIHSMRSTARSRTSAMEARSSRSSKSAPHEECMNIITRGFQSRRAAAESKRLPPGQHAHQRLSRAVRRRRSAHSTATPGPSRSRRKTARASRRGTGMSFVRSGRPTSRWIFTA